MPVNLKQIKNISLKFFEYLLNFGIDDKTPSIQIKRIRLLNVFCWFWHIRTWLSLLNEFLLGTSTKTIYLTFFLSTSIVVLIQFLQYYRKYFIARILFVYSVMFLCFTYSVFINPGINIELNFVLVPGVTIVLFNKKKVIRFISISSVIIVYITIFFLHNYQNICLLYTSPSPRDA